MDNSLTRVLHYFGLDEPSIDYYAWFKDFTCWASEGFFASINYSRMYSQVLHKLYNCIKVTRSSLRTELCVYRGDTVWSGAFAWSFALLKQSIVVRLVLFICIRVENVYTGFYRSPRYPRFPSTTCDYNVRVSRLPEWERHTQWCRDETRNYAVDIKRWGSVMVLVL